MERFQHVVRLGVFGHTHKDYFEVGKSMTNIHNPIMVNSIGGGLTTYGGCNPSFKVMEMDAKTLLPLKITNYYADLGKANSEGTSPEWVPLLDYTSKYDMKDLSPSSYIDLANQLKDDQDMMDEFWKYARKTPSKADIETNDEDEEDGGISNGLSGYCRLVTTETHEKRYC